MPIDVVDFEGSAPQLTVDVEIYQEYRKNQLGWRSLRTQRNAGSYAFVKGIFWPPRRHESWRSGFGGL